MIQNSQIMKYQTGSSQKMKYQIGKRKRTSSTTTTTTTTTSLPPCLPHEIIFFHILPKLPSSCLHRFNCVSKLWYNTIHDPKFITTHLTHAKSNPSLVALLYYAGRSKDVFLRLLHLRKGAGRQHHSNNNASLDLQLKSVLIVGNCNGFICNKLPYAIEISNPTTRELLTFPKPKLSPLTESLSRSDGGSGFGFDHVVNEYKVLQICFDYTSEYYDIWIYTLGTNLWRNITATCNYLPSCYPNDFAPPICIKGALYWAAGRFGNKMLSFDLHLEKFQVVPCPQVPVGYKQFRNLFELGGHPCLAYHNTLIKDGFQLRLIMMKNHHHHSLGFMHTKQQQQDSSSSVSWTRTRNDIRLSFKPDTDSASIKIVAHSEQIYLQWITMDGVFVLYNVNKKISWMKLSGLFMMQRVVLVNHVENLLSLKTFVPPSSAAAAAAGEIEVDYVSSRKAKHDGPTTTSCCNDLRRQQRKKRRIVASSLGSPTTPWWISIII